MQKSIKYFLFTLILLSLNGCALLRDKQTNTPKITLFKNQTIELPPPSDLPFNIRATQILTANYSIKGKQQSYTSQMEVEKINDKLIMVALGGWGGEIFSIQYQGNVIKSSSLPMPHSSMGIKYALTDFILTYAPKNLLKKIFRPTDIHIQFKQKQRLFMLDKKPIIIIKYTTSNDPWKSNVTIENLIYHYRINIQTLSVKSLAKAK